MLVELDVDTKTIREIEKIVKLRTEILGETIDSKSILSNLLSWEIVSKSNYLYNSSKAGEKINCCIRWVNSQNEEINRFRAIILKNKEFNSVFNLIKEKREDVFKLIRIEFDKLKSCKNCDTCCCRNRFGYFEKRDLIYYAIIGKELSISNDLILNRVNGNDRCIYLTKQGCVLEYNMRPFTCVTALCSKIDNELRKKKLTTRVDKLTNYIRNISDIIYPLINILR